MAERGRCRTRLSTSRILARIPTTPILTQVDSTAIDFPLCLWYYLPLPFFHHETELRCPDGGSGHHCIWHEGSQYQSVILSSLHRWRSHLVAIRSGSLSVLQRFRIAPSRLVREVERRKDHVQKNRGRRIGNADVFDAGDLYGTVIRCRRS